VNAALTGFIELILFFFSIQKGLGVVVQASVTGAFLMNLLVIPGLAMFAAGLKWKEVTINKKVQGVSGTIMFLVIVAIFFPSVLYKLYAVTDVKCRSCAGFNILSASELNCTDCSSARIANIYDDPAYKRMARPFVWVVSGFMPVLYTVGMLFSLKTHSYIWHPLEEANQEEGAAPALSTPVCVVLLAVNCAVFSFVCEVLTDHMGEAIEQLGMTERFVGLVFYTLVPAVAEFINAMRFALEGNLGLSLEIGNQGAMVVSLLQMPALVLISELLGHDDPKSRFTLMFETIDVFAVIIAVLLRNMMLMEEEINYFTGFAFIGIFFFIALVYWYLDD
jgi:Ca2+:H+ antiporter